MEGKGRLEVEDVVKREINVETYEKKLQEEGEQEREREKERIRDKRWRNRADRVREKETK